MDAWRKSTRPRARSLPVSTLHFPVVRPDGLLIAGERRLVACRQLGWTEVPVHVLDLDDVIRGEFAENACRKDFDPSELVAIGEAVESMERERAKARQREGGRSGGKASRNLPEASSGDARDKTAAQLGISSRTYEKAKAVVTAAREEPETFGALVEEMDRRRSVNSAYRKLQQALDERRVLGLRPIAGKFKTLLVDPPWKYDQDITGRAKPGYATMSLDELRALDVAAWADDGGCHLYLCSTNSFVIRAGELMEHWGFRQITMLTWKKPNWCLGNHFRNETEHVYFGVRGNLHVTPAAHSIATWFEAPRGHEHSEKPERLYEIIRDASYPSYGEAFQRTPRPDFTNLFERVEAHPEATHEAAE
jgi:N6-adenosine-specific RNA methylase IME4